jgi:hypothetical protein
VVNVFLPRGSEEATVTWQKLRKEITSAGVSKRETGTGK